MKFFIPECWGRVYLSRCVYLALYSINIYELEVLGWAALLAHINSAATPCPPPPNVISNYFHHKLGRAVYFSQSHRLCKKWRAGGFWGGQVNFSKSPALLAGERKWLSLHTAEILDSTRFVFKNFIQVRRFLHRSSSSLRESNHFGEFKLPGRRLMLLWDSSLIWVHHSNERCVVPAPAARLRWQIHSKILRIQLNFSLTSHQSSAFILTTNQLQEMGN